MKNQFYAFVVFAKVLKHALAMIFKKMICTETHNFNILYLKHSKENHSTNAVNLASYHYLKCSI